MKGSTIRLIIDGVVQVTGSDTAITAPGRAGVLFTSTSTAPTNTSGLHLRFYSATPRAIDAQATNTGSFNHGVALGA